MKLYPNITHIFIIWLVLVLFLAYFGFSVLPHSGKFSDNFFQSFANWDGGHYLGIAEYGYKEKFQYAFFPLYPILIKGVNSILQNYLLSGILISILSTFFALHLFYKLVVHDFDKKVAEKVILLLLFFPTSFYFLTAYSEGLFFLLVVLAFYFTRRGNLLLATIAVSLSSATRLVGLAAVFAFLYEVQSTRGINSKNWYVLFAPLGSVIYSWYMWTQTADPFYFFTAQAHWQRSLSIPGLNFWETIKSLAMPGFLTNNFNAFLDLIFATFGLGMIIRSARFLPVTYSIYGFFSLILPLLTPTLSSIPRFLLPIFPIFILLGLIKNNYINLAYQIISLMLLSLFIALFVNGYWIS